MKKSLRKIAIFLAINILLPTTTITPLFASGPSSPEAAGFEAANTGNMVNLPTGGLNYTLPVMYVPSPEGGYPITLSYHANVTPDMEASWVGLGWSLTPGAINRSVNGVPDDWGATAIEKFGTGAKLENVLARGLFEQSGSIGETVAMGSNHAGGMSLNENFPARGAAIKKGYNEATYLNQQTSGIGYPYDTEMNSITSMDAYSLYPFSRYSIDYLEGFDLSGEYNLLTLPAYDTYGVSAHGLTGSFKLMPLAELGLSIETGNSDREQVSYRNSNATASPYELGNNLFFSFENKNNSFSRIQMSTIAKENIGTNGVIGSFADFEEAYQTDLTNNYSLDEVSTANGIEAIANGNKLRTGHNIIAYTNEQIRDSYDSNGQSDLALFMDTRESSIFSTSSYLDRSNTEKFVDEGVGAYTIVSTDGTRYHYALPVYNLYTSSTLSSDQNRYSNGQTKPYATNWLLTAITGADYIDVNQNSLVDKPDVGYWVCFDYGLWSEGQYWESSGATFNDPSDQTKQVTRNTFGIKEHYYLDAITTKSHRAFFYKSMRKDKNPKKNTYGDSDWDGNEPFDYEKHSEIVTSNEKTLLGTDIIGDFYDENGNPITINPNTEYTYKDTKATYFELNNQAPLQLDRIVLTENNGEDINSFRKENATSLFKKGAFLARNDFITELHPTNLPNNKIDAVFNRIGKFDLKSYNYELVDNVVYEHAAAFVADPIIQEVAFEYDYSLVQGLRIPSNDDPLGGRLTLKKFYQNKALIPPYEFDYNLLYDLSPYEPGYLSLSNDISLSYQAPRDSWGYIDNYLSQGTFNLNEIITPTSNHINITYEGHNYYTAVTHKTLFNAGGVYKTAYIASSQYDGNNHQDLAPGNSRIYFELEYNKQITNELAEANITRDLAIDFKLFRKSLTGNEYVSYRFNGKPSVELITNDATNNKATIAISILKSALETEIVTGNALPRLSTYSSKYITNISGVNYIDQYKISAINRAEPKPSIIDQLNIDAGSRVHSITSGGKTTFYEYEPGIISYRPGDTIAIPYKSLLPTPVVMYNKVTTYSDPTNSVKTVYEFETLQPEYNQQEDDDILFSLGNAFWVERTQHQKIYEGNNKTSHLDKYVVHDHLSTLGRTNAISTYNSEGQLLSKKEYRYKKANELEADGEIGVREESYKTIKKIALKNTDIEKYFMASTNKINYPNKLVSVSEYGNGNHITTYYNKHDFLTGMPLEVSTSNAKGGITSVETIPAYKIPEYDTSSYGMGSSIDHSTNKNMLIQNAISKSYIDGNPTGASITTWNNKWKYKSATSYGIFSSPTLHKEKFWRPHKSFVWQGRKDRNGTLTNFFEPYGNFDWTVMVNAEETSEISQPNFWWKNTGTTVLYDQHSRAINSRDINGNYSSQKFGDYGSNPLFTCNAPESECYYSGFEYGTHRVNQTTNGGYLDGNIHTFFTPIFEGHTGTKHAKLELPQHFISIQIPENIDRTGKKQLFKIGVWVKATDIEHLQLTDNGIVIDFDDSENVVSKSWVLLSTTVTFDAGEHLLEFTSNGGSVELDDFRIHPAYASMTSYVYNEKEELTYVIGPNHLATRYEYDAAGRLIKTAIEVETTASDYRIDQYSDGFMPINSYKYTYKTK